MTGQPVSWPRAKMEKILRYDLRLQCQTERRPMRTIGTSFTIGVFTAKNPQEFADEQNAFVARDSNLDGDLNCQRICER
jgi:hypothetical protein